MRTRISNLMERDGRFYYRCKVPEQIIMRYLFMMMTVYKPVETSQNYYALCRGFLKSTPEGR